MFYAMKDIVTSSLTELGFKMILLANHKFHLKEGLIPDIISKVWLRGKNFDKKSNLPMWNVLKNNYLSFGKTKFPIIPGMMEGIMQQTSSMLHAVKVTFSNYLIKKCCEKNEFAIHIRDGVTSDDSGKAITLRSIKKKISKKEEIQRNEEEGIRVLYKLEKIDSTICKAFSMLENFKKSFRHSNIFEINQNWIVLKS